MVISGNSVRVIMSFTLLVQGKYTMKYWAVIYCNPSMRLDPHDLQPHFLMNMVGWGGVGAMETTGHPGIGACRLPPGPLHSRGLSVKAENFPLKLCKLSLECLCPQPPPPTPNPFRAPHLHPPPYPPKCSSPLPLFLPLVTPSWNSPSTFPKSDPHIPPLSPSQAMQSKNWTWKKKKEWRRKSLVSLLQTK